MPEPGAAAILKELTPPLAVRFGSRPRFQGREVAPILAHPQVPHGIDYVLMQQQAIGLRRYSIRDFRPKAQERSNPGDGVDPHPEVDDHEVRVMREIDRVAVRAS
ncbi:MAG TPA: hypothetical protein VN442_18675 [Bryobacteraceae bacterium]|nr:hypothetical protein [Bryobacteraceae bacterium]